MNGGVFFIQCLRRKRRDGQTYGSRAAKGGGLPVLFKMTTASLYKHYEKGGISGTLAAVSRAAYDSSPHKIVGSWLAEVTQSIAETMAKEWTGLTCLDPSVIAEAVCGVISYVGVDIITGKVVVSALSKSAKFAEAMTAVRNKLEKAPITGEWLTKHLKPADPSQCAEPQNESWMVDADAKLQGQHLVVTVSKGLVLAKGIHPKTGKLECFQVIGKQGDQIRNRVSSTADRTKTAPAAGSTDFFSPQNSKIARTEENYVRDINGRVGV
ncbi:MAG: hypothetical protein IPJ84_09595 [Bdellovibrionales bacterium]|nr:hypothetical protein [Bdellovibrionales bacterium]